MDITLGSLDKFEMSGGNIVMHGEDYSDRINGCVIGAGTLCDGNADGVNVVGIKEEQNELKLNVGSVGIFDITGGSMLITKKAKAASEITTENPQNKYNFNTLSKVKN
jgi:hypothetical protein